MIAVILVLLLAGVYFAIGWYAIKAIRWIVRNWTHPTIAQMQAEMLCEVWNYWALRRYFLAEKIDVPPGFTRIYRPNAHFEEAP